MSLERLTGRIKVVTKLLLAHEKEHATRQAFRLKQATALGLHPTDLQCLRHLLQYGPCPAGDLTALTGLTTGAMTSLIDRLERSGYVRREIDKADRRKVLVKAIPHKCKRLLTAEGTYTEQAHQILEDYTLEELAIITDFLEKSTTLHSKESSY